MNVSDVMMEKIMNVNISKYKRKEYPLHKLNSMKSHNIDFTWNYIERFITLYKNCSKKL